MPTLNAAGFSNVLQDIYTQAMEIQERVLKDAKPAKLPKKLLLKNNDGGYLSCNYCGTGWLEGEPWCVACGAPLLSALQHQRLKEDEPKVVEKVVREYAYAPRPKQMVMMCSTSSDYGMHLVSSDCSFLTTDLHMADSDGPWVRT